ncbi:MAG: PHP domain-containing protein [Anaerolineales bacterium]|nr:PHP domain-containing protein [Anaerolineales bacterium]
MTQLLRVDFHCHTHASRDSLTSPGDLVAAARRHGLDRVVVTDHNTIAGARLAQEIDPELVIVGEEIMTTRGEILAAFVAEEIPRGLSPRETLTRLRDQGAFISVSHPFDSMRNGSWSLEDLLEIAALVDAIEVFNSRCMEQNANHLAEQFSCQRGLAGTAGSDAHTAFELGRAVLVVPPFEGPDGLREVIGKGQVEGRLSGWWVHFFSFYARIHKMKTKDKV